MNSISINKSSFNPKKSFYLFNFYLIVIVLLFSGINKIIDPQPLIETILKIDRFAKSTNLIEDNFVIAFATLLPVIEITLGVMLLLKMNLKITFRIITILLSFFFLFSIYGFKIGLENDCGCFGRAIQSDFGWWMIIRNLLLLVATIYLTINEKNNPGAGK